MAKRETPFSGNGRKHNVPVNGSHTEVIHKQHCVWYWWTSTRNLKIMLLIGFAVAKLNKTRSTQRAQTSLAEADHYSHIAHCKNVEPWLWKTTQPPKKKKKKKKRFWIITFTTIWVCYHYYGVFFAHLLILQYPDHHQNLISSSLYYSGPVHKISTQSVHNFWVMLSTDKQTDRQTNQHYQKHNLLCQGGKKWGKKPKTTNKKQNKKKHGNQFNNNINSI